MFQSKNYLELSFGSDELPDPIVLMGANYFRHDFQWLTKFYER